MSSPGQHYGQSLPDQFDGLTSFFDVHLELIADVRELYREFVVIEKEYATKLQTLYKKAIEKKSRMESAMVVGSEPTKAWDQNTIGQSTLYLAYTQLVTSISQISQDHVSKADAVTSQVIDPLKTLEKRNDDLKKKEVQFFQKLIGDRDRVAADRGKAKQRYDEDALEADAVQQKHASVPWSIERTGTLMNVRQAKAHDDKHAERAARHAEQQRNEMLNSKNSYLISIAVANRTKSKFYGEDMPALEDRLQVIQTKMLLRFSSVVQHAQSLETNLAQTLQSRYSSVVDSFQRLDLQADQDIYVDHNIRPFSMPPDLVFEPCHNHYDTAEMNVEPAPKVYLQNRLSKSRVKLGELEPVYDSKRKEVSEHTDLFYSFEPGSANSNPEDLSERFIDASQQSTFYGTSHCILTTEIETIVSAIGDDEGAQQPHTFKSSTFSIPTQCGYCKSSIWGLSKQGKTCKLCGLSVHTKCELKVPADCRRAQPSRTSSVVSRKGPPSTSSIMSTKPSAPTPSSFVTPSVSEEIAEDYPVASMIYDFTATSEFEISLAEGTLVRVLESDDGSGWAKVMDSNNNDGLVPSSYIEYQEQQQESSGPKVRALYDYQAQGADEISLQAGQVFELTTGPSGGQNYGDGWWEGISAQGRTGIFPSNYVELL